MNIPLWRRRDPLAADRLNQTTGAVNTHLPIIGGAGILVGGGGAGGTVVSLASGDGSLPDGVFRVKNNSGADRKRFDIMGLDGPMVDADTDLFEFQNTIAFKGVIPTAPTHYGRWGVLLTPINSGDSGLVRVTGVAVVRIHINDSHDLNAGIASGDPSHLESSPIAVAGILATSIDADGQTWAYVKLGNTFNFAQGCVTGSGS